VKGFFRQLANRVQSGSARTGLDDDATDYYPVPLERSALRPGTIYADPYGHVMVVVKWVDQTADKGGLLLAVDGQPDTSIGRKRFWEGTFLFANDVKSAGPGFKAFRPIARGADGKLEPAANAAIGGKGDAAHAPFSDEQKKVSADGFYARMGKLINPQGLDAEKAYRETLDALVEQMTVRVGSVDNGEKYQKEKGAGQVIPMPDGAKIFETTGPWEDYATPSRDMRLLIAIDTVTALPGRVEKKPERFALPEGTSPHAAAEALRAALDWAFARGVNRAVASVDPRNTASVALLCSLGMRQEAHFRESYWLRGEWADDLVFALLAREWRAGADQAAGTR
jgi:hypothetical protein